MATYEDNVVRMLKRRGLSAKYEHAGIYCIRQNNKIVYVGKSVNMLRRIAQHYVGIKTGSERKYRILAEVQGKGYGITFDVLYNATQANPAAIETEIGQKESEYINLYRPILNSQIPHEGNYRQYTKNYHDARDIVEYILSD